MNSHPCAAAARTSSLKLMFAPSEICTESSVIEGAETEVAGFFFSFFPSRSRVLYCATGFFEGGQNTMTRSPSRMRKTPQTTYAQSEAATTPGNTHHPPII